MRGAEGSPTRVAAGTEAVEHAAVGHDGDGLPGVAHRQALGAGHAARVERGQRFAASGP